jgi:hypothetical protein
MTYILNRLCQLHDARSATMGHSLSLLNLSLPWFMQIHLKRKNELNLQNKSKVSISRTIPRSSNFTLYKAVIKSVCRASDGIPNSMFIKLDKIFNLSGNAIKADGDSKTPYTVAIIQLIYYQTIIRSHGVSKPARTTA